MSPRPIILCAFDASTPSEGALVLAADLAARLFAALHVVHVHPDGRAPLTTEGTPSAEHTDRTREAVDAILRDNAVDGPVPVFHQSHGESAADGILRWAVDLQADIVVVGTHGRRGVERLLAGSVAAEVLRRSTAPVLVVPAHTGPVALTPTSPVLVGVDLAEPSEAILRLGSRLAEAFQTTLAVAYVRAAPPDKLIPEFHRPHLAAPVPRRTREEAHEALQTLVAHLDADSVEQHVVPGHPVPELMALARQIRAGLLVIGTHGRRGWERLRLGSVAEGIIRESRCPIAVLPMNAGAPPA